MLGLSWIKRKEYKYILASVGKICKEKKFDSRGENKKCPR